MCQKGNAQDLRRKMNRLRNNVYCNRKQTAKGKKKGNYRKKSFKKLERWKGKDWWNRRWEQNRKGELSWRGSRQNKRRRQSKKDGHYRLRMNHRKKDSLRVCLVESPKLNQCLSSQLRWQRHNKVPNLYNHKADLNQILWVPGLLNHKQDLNPNLRQSYLRVN